MKPLYSIGLPCLVLLSGLSLWLWMDYMAVSSDPTYDQDPERWAGAAGATAGLDGPLVLPPLEATASSTLRSREALDGLLDKTLTELTAKLGQPSQSEAKGDRQLAVWHSAVIMDVLPRDRHPVAHLRVELRGAGGAAQVVTVTLLGSLGHVLAQAPAASDTPSIQDPKPSEGPFPAGTQGAR